MHACLHVLCQCVCVCVCMHVLCQCVCVCVCVCACLLACTMPVWVCACLCMCTVPTCVCACILVCTVPVCVCVCVCVCACMHVYACECTMPVCVCLASSNEICVCMLQVMKFLSIKTITFSHIFAYSAVQSVHVLVSYLAKLMFCCQLLHLLQEDTSITIRSSIHNNQKFSSCVPSDKQCHFADHHRVLHLVICELILTHAQNQSPKQKTTVIQPTTCHWSLEDVNPV